MSYINSFITKCNQILLGSSDEAIAARDYLTKLRHLSLDSISNYKIGYCPSSCTLPKEISSFGEKDDEDYIKRDFSFFIKGKVIVPIYDEFSRLVAFSTRAPNTLKESTWWNVPFVKGSNLFLLNMARKEIFNKNKVYVVEGQMDALILYQQGIKNVVSLMGTNLSLRQIGLVTRYCSNICFCYDVDKNNAGQNAQNKSIASINKLNHLDGVSIIRGMPEGVDPDQFVISEGIEKFLSMEVELSKDDIKRIIKQAEQLE